MSQMFEKNPWNLPEENFIYLIALLKRKQVKLLIWQVSQDSAVIDLEDAQYNEDYEVASLNETREDWKGEELIVAQDMSLDAYSHNTIIMSTNNLTRRITFSVPNDTRLKDGSLVKNPIFEFTRKINDESIAIYSLACFVYMVCCFWQYFVDNDIDAWSKMFSIKKKDNERYFKNSFDYQSDVCQSLVDVFGQAETEDLITEFTPKCSCCDTGLT